MPSNRKSEAGDYKSTAPDEKNISHHIIPSNNFSNPDIDIINSLKQFSIVEDELNIQDPEFLENFFEALLSTKIFKNFEECIKVLEVQNEEMVKKLELMREGVKTLDDMKVKEKLDLEHEKRIIKETRIFMDEKEREIENDVQDYEMYINFEKKI